MCAQSSRIYSRLEIVQNHQENYVGTQCQTIRKSRCGVCYIYHITPWEKCPPSELGFLWLFHIRRSHIYKAFSGSGCLRRSHFRSPPVPNYHSREYLRQECSGRHSNQQDSAYRLYTSALRVLPMILPSRRRGERSAAVAQTKFSKTIPRCGTLLQ
jgi:hypothetical protein